MNTTRNSLLVGVVLLIAGLVTWHFFKTEAVPVQTNEAIHIATSTEDVADQDPAPTVVAPKPAPCDIDTRTCREIAYGFQLRYPAGWHTKYDNLSSPYGMWEFYNYDEGKAAGKDIFPPGDAKIQIAITSNPTSLSKPPCTYPETRCTADRQTVAGRTAVRTEILHMGDDVTIAYDIPLLSKPGYYLSIVLFGDPPNTAAFDTMVQSISWI